MIIGKPIERTLMTTILLSTILLACGPKTPSESNATPTIPNEVQTTEESEVQPTEEVLPTPKGPILGALDKADIDATIKTAMPNIQTCYENAAEVRAHETGNDKEKKSGNENENENNNNKKDGQLVNRVIIFGAKI